MVVMAQGAEVVIENADVSVFLQTPRHQRNDNERWWLNRMFLDVL